MSAPSPAKPTAPWPHSRIILLITALCAAIAGGVYLADRFSIRDRNITTQPATSPATETAPATSASKPASATPTP